MGGELRQRRPIVKKSKRRSQAEVEAGENFKREVLRLDTGRCIVATAFGSQHRCDGPLEAHHAIRQQTLRVHISTLGLDEPALLDWLWSPDIGVTLCQRTHAQHTTRLSVVPFEWLPARTVDFAEARSVRHLLEREHPPLFSDGLGA